MPEKLPVVRFNKLYPKLDGRFFNTIRRTTNLEEDDVVMVQTPMTRFRAVVTFVKETPLHQIPTSTITWDTDTTTRPDALEELRKYYPKLNWQSTVYLVGFKRADTRVEDELKSRWEDGY